MGIRLLALALLLGACGAAADEPPTTPQFLPETSLPATSAPAPTSALDAPPLEIDDCVAPQVTFSTLCEVYELVDKWHVDRPADAEALAAAALEGIREFETSETEEPPRTLICAIPTAAFVEMCNEIHRRVAEARMPIGPAIEAAVLRMTDTALDPFTYYLPPGQTGSYRLNGVVGGIGVLLDATDAVGSKCAKVTEVCELRIVFVLEANPGADAGLMADDIITDIDGSPVDGLGFVEAGTLIAGDETGTVDLGVLRDGQELEFTIDREELAVPSVEVEMPVPGVGYLRIPDFEADIPQLVNDSLDALEEIGYHTVVVDLRDNPGGFVDAAVYVISEFVDGGTVLIESYGTEEYELLALDGGQATDKRILILVNQGTASAAEITAMALRGSPWRHDPRRDHVWQTCRATAIRDEQRRRAPGCRSGLACARGGFCGGRWRRARHRSRDPGRAYADRTGRTGTRQLMRWGLALAASVLGACALGSSTGPTDPPATSTTAHVAATSSIAPNGRVIEVVGCGDSPGEAEIVCEAYELIKDNYVDDVPDQTLAQGAAEGLDRLDGATSNSPLTCVAPTAEFVEVCSVAPDEAEDATEAAEAMVFGMLTFALDPNSSYLTQELVELTEEEQSGEVEGIGALVNTFDEASGERCNIVSSTCRIVIASVVTGSPAEGAGVVAGDVVIAVRGESIEGWTIDEVTSTVRGKAGTDVDLTFLRDGAEYEVTITRAAVEVPVVTTELVGDAGYVRLSQFTDNGDEQLREAIFGLLAEGVDTLVFDLRDNPGGLLTTAIDVASQFIDDGDVVETVGPGSSRVYEVSGQRLVPEDVEVVVVVNGGSASASELISALLQERERATIVGVNTFGKNTVQQQFDLSNGGAVKLTIARWVTPEGLDFGEVGVTPDVVEDFPPGLTAEAVVELALSIS